MEFGTSSDNLATLRITVILSVLTAIRNAVALVYSLLSGRLTVDEYCSRILAEKDAKLKEVDVLDTPAIHQEDSVDAYSYFFRAMVKRDVDLVSR